MDVQTKCKQINLMAHRLAPLSPIPIEQIVVKLAHHYIGPCKFTYTEMAILFNVTKQRIDQIMIRATRKLHKNRRKHKPIFLNTGEDNESFNPHPLYQIDY